MPSSSISVLRARLWRWSLRLRLVESLSWGPWGAVAGLGVGLLLALAARLWPLLAARQLAGVAGLCVLLGVTLGLAITWLRPRPALRLARTFDRRFGLAERLTTALEIDAGLSAPPVMVRAQLADALHAARRTNPREGLPLRAPRRPLVATLVLVAGLTLSLWLPNPQEDVLLQRAAVRAAIEEQVEALEAMREEVAQADALTETQREMLLEALEEAIAGLEDAGERAVPEEALATLAEAEEALAALRDAEASELQAGLGQAAEALSDSELTRDIAEALAGGDYRRAAEALASFADQEGQQLTREEELALARELAQAAQALAESDPQLAEQLAQAAASIERGDIADAQEAIRAAAERMAEAGARAEAQEAVEGALAEMQDGREQIAQAGGT